MTESSDTQAKPVNPMIHMWGKAKFQPSPPLFQTLSALWNPGDCKPPSVPRKDSLISLLLLLSRQHVSKLPLYTPPRGPKRPHIAPAGSSAPCAYPGTPEIAYGATSHQLLFHLVSCFCKCLVRYTSGNLNHQSRSTDRRQRPWRTQGM